MTGDSGPGAGKRGEAGGDSQAGGHGPARSVSGPDGDSGDSRAAGGGTSAAGAAALPEGAVLRRTAAGWTVGSEDVSDLTSAMVLADLIAAELPDSAAEPSGGFAHAGDGTGAASGENPGDRLRDEARRLRVTVGQLERALAVRVRVEQAIGVLAERHRVRPRQAFEQLRSVARGRGQRVIDIAGDVIASATNPLLPLPEELSRPAMAQRHSARRQRRARDGK